MSLDFDRTSTIVTQITQGGDQRALVTMGIPDDHWMPTGPTEDPARRLTGPVMIINGQGLHIEAWELGISGRPIQPTDDEDSYEIEVTWSALDNAYAALQQVYDGRYETTVIRGRTYVIVLFPYVE